MGKKRLSGRSTNPGIIPQGDNIFYLFFLCLFEGGGGGHIRYDVYVSMISQHTRQSFELKFNSRN